MLKNYLKIMTRNLAKHKGYTFINVFGLAVGIACCLLIFIFVRHEWSFDSFHEQKDSIYALYIDETRPDGSQRFRRLIPLGVPEALAVEIPGVKRVVQLVTGPATIFHDGQPFREDIFQADSTFFEIFSFPLLAGGATNVLNDPGKMVISEKIAQKYFGVETSTGFDGVLGKRLAIQMRNGVKDFRISGVMQDCPANSSLQLDILISFKNYANLSIGSNDWNGRTSTYILLDEGQRAEDIERALLPFTALHFKDRVEAQIAEGSLLNREHALQLRLQPLGDVHFNTKIPVEYEQPVHNDIYSIILLGIAVLVLLIACINFTTLSVARATDRAREVGLRKTIGAQKRQLMAQFWGEALALSFLATLFAIIIAEAALPFVSDLTGRSLSLFSLIDPAAIFALLALAMIVSLLAGGYPSLVLAGFQPAKVLKGDVKAAGGSAFMRSLVVAQYTISIALMLCAGIMGEQLEFLRTKDLGFNDDMIVVVSARGKGSPQFIERYRNALAGHAEITKVVGAGQAFTVSSDSRSWQDAQGVTRVSYVYGADYDYVDLMEMKIAAGRNFSREIAGDATSGVLVNETLVREFGLAEPVGKTLQGFMSGTFQQAPVILGVVRDFNFISLHEQIKPAVLVIHPGYFARYQNVFVKIRPENIPATLALLKEKWLEVAPDAPFSYSFLDDNIQRQYRAEERWAQVIRASTTLAIVIACMGLFALAALIVRKRTKEIGIRKVVGASVWHLIVLLTKDFVLLVGAAFVLAAPLGYFAMSEWLLDFAYRIEIGWWIFALVGGLAFAIVIATVSTQAIRAALANPVQALRYE
jgi:putative ABC transport system permease protein